jgi:hypothetical protein
VNAAEDANMPRGKKTGKAEHVIWNVRFRSGYIWAHIGSPTFMTHALLLAHEMRRGTPYCTFITYDMPPTP